MIRSILKYIKNFKFSSIFIRNFILILIMVFLPVGSISLAVYHYINDATQKELANAGMDGIAKSREIIDMFLIESSRLAIRLATDENVEKFVNASDETVNYNFSKTVNSIIKNVDVSLFSSGYIDSVYIYSDSKKFILSSKDTGRPIGAFPDKDWLEDFYTNKSNRQNVWISSRNSKDIYGNSEYSYLTYFNIINGAQGKSGLIMVNINLNTMYKLLSGDEKGTISGSLYIVNHQDDIVYDLPEGKHANTPLADLLPVTGDSKGTPRIMKVGGEMSVVSSIGSNYNDWTYISTTSIQQYSKKLNNLKGYFIFGFFVCIIMVIILSLIIAVKVFEPIEIIVSIIENSGKYKDNVGIIKRYNELKYIATNIVDKRNEFKEMQQELASKMERLKKAQNLALQSQTNPHFIFNTLESVNWMVMELAGVQNPASKMLCTLSGLIRLSMEANNDIVPIKIEMEHVQLYLEIQKIRYNNLLEVVWDVDERLLEYQTVKLTLQPIVENAILHGIGPKKKRCTLTIGCHEAGETVVFIIEDNGVGIEPAMLEKINAELSSDYIKETSQIGMSNVNQRIKLTFGEEYGVVLQNRETEGTQVKLVIPKVKQTHHDAEY